MDFETKYISNDIKLSEFKGHCFKTEVMFEHHILVWFISGETKIVQADATYTFNAGDIFLIPRNQLATIMNYPKDGKPHKSVAMHFTKERLQNYYAKYKPKNIRSVLQKIHRFPKHTLLESCMASLIPYFDLGDHLPTDIASIKIEEAITILRSIDKNADSLLADFDEPGKIDIANFMERNFMFNMPLHRFGYLTGRSLATFRRDFKKAFNTNPQKWLTERRLKMAHYEIAEKQRPPTDVYWEAGFENLSHFSYAFKNHYGYSPQSLIREHLK